MTGYTHLSEDTKGFINLSDTERKKIILRTRWFGYNRAREIINRLMDVYEYPRIHRMLNVLIVGDTNNGKTMIVSQFEKRLLEEKTDNILEKRPVLLVQAPPEPEESRFYSAIMRKLSFKFEIRDRIDKRQHDVITILSRIDLKILIIDEIHHILAGNLNKQRHFLNTIKYLSNELMISIVGVGVKSAFNAIQTDPQLANRFEPMLLPLWKYNEEFLQLLVSFENKLPLKKPSNLVNEKLSTRIFEMSEGILGEIVEILRRSAIKAVDTGTERINSRMLDLIKWTNPSDRKKWSMQRRR